MQSGASAEQNEIKFGLLLSQSCSDDDLNVAGSSEAPSDLPTLLDHNDANVIESSKRFGPPAWYVKGMNGANSGDSWRSAGLRPPFTLGQRYAAW